MRKLIQWKEKEYKRLQDNIPRVVCPNCGSKSVCVDSDSFTQYLFCKDCEEWLEEAEEEYLYAYNELCSFQYADTINMHIWGYGFKITPGEEWNKFCEKEIKEILRRE